MKKAAILATILLFFVFNGVFAKTELPYFTLFPEKYLAGEETLYLEGRAPPESEVIISLQKGQKEIKQWQVVSNEVGEWSFSSRELVSSGKYHLALKEKGKEAAFSDCRQIEIALSGFSLPVPSFFKTWVGKDSYPIAFRDLTLALALILGGKVIFALYFMVRTWQTKAILKKEVHEARAMLLSSFESLNKEIEEQIELFDFQPGFSAREREVCEELKRSLIASRHSIEKEIKDIEEKL